MEANSLKRKYLNDFAQNVVRAGLLFPANETNHRHILSIRAAFKHIVLILAEFNFFRFVFIFCHSNAAPLFIPHLF
jgi:hypothetical protein